MYDQWRGDHVFPDSPEGNGFGFINYDGTKTENYEEKLNIVRLLNKLSDEIVNAEKKRCGLAILSSNHAFMSADATENGADAVKNSYLELHKSLYKHFRAEGITVDVIETDMLASNPLGFKVVIVPKYSLISEQEKADLAAFAANGGAVYTCEDATLSMYKLGEAFVKYENASHNVLDVLEANGIEPIILSSNRNLMVQVIEGDGYAVACLNNISTAKPVLSGVKLTLNQVKATRAMMHTPYGETELTVNGDVIELPDIKEGAFIVLK